MLLWSAGPIGLVHSRGVCAVHLSVKVPDQACLALPCPALPLQFHIRPSEQRKLDATETQKRLQKRAFKEKIRWILKRKAR